MNARQICLVIAAGALLLALGAWLVLRPRPVKIGPIRSFHFLFVTGTASNACVEYRLRHEDGVYTVSVRTEGTPPEEAAVRTVDAAFAASLEALLREHGVSHWNGFDRNNRHVFDGRSFSLHIVMEDDTSLSAQGYMVWPRGFTPFCAALGALFTAA